MNDKMFKINDYVVYKKDVCQIIDIKKRNDIDYYVLVPVNDQSLKVDVPIENKLGSIRKLIDKEEIERIIKEIPSIKVIETTDRLIENDYKKLLLNPSHEDLIKIIKTTYARNKERLDNNKKIGDKDNNYFNKCEQILYTEFSVVLGMNYDETKEYILSKVKENEE